MKIRKFMAACTAFLTFIWLVVSVQAAPIVTLSENVGGGIGEFIVDIESPIDETWYIIMFAAENERSALAGGGGAFVDNEIGTWDGRRFAPNQWQADFAFEFDTPGDPETIITTLGLGDFVDLFGTGTFAHAYWPTSYLDFSTGPTFSLIGPNETRGGFKFSTDIVASRWVALVQDDQGNTLILRDEIDNGGGGGGNMEVPEPASLALLGFGAISLAIARRRLRR